VTHQRPLAFSALVISILHDFIVSELSIAVEAMEVRGIEVGGWR